MNSGLKYMEHIAWVKRKANPSCRLLRSHESIYIYTLNKKKFYTTKGRYEDVKLPGIMFDVVTIESLKRYVAAIRCNGKDGGGIKKNTNCHDVYKRFHFSSVRSPEFVNFTNVWSFLSPKAAIHDLSDSLHPTMKPLELMERLIELLTPPEAVVLDPFMGSGTTGVACVKLDRKFIGIEKESDYFEIAKQRIYNEIRKPRQIELFKD